MLNGLLDSHTGSLLLLEASKGEGESSSLFFHPNRIFNLQSDKRVKKESSHLLLDLSKGGSGSLHLELVGDVALLVDGRLGLLGSGLSVGRGGDQDVNTVNLSLFEELVVLLSLLVGRGVEDDSLRTIRGVLQVLARELT